MSEITVTKRDREMATEAIGDVFDASPGVVADWAETGESMPSDDSDGSGEWVHEDNAELWYSVAAAIAKARAEGVEEERARCVGVAREWEARFANAGDVADPAWACQFIANGIASGEQAYVAASCEPEAAREGGRE